MTRQDDEWLRSRHASWVTPDDELDDLVRAATGHCIAARARIIRGEANETYRVTDAAGNELTLKVAHDRPGAFSDLERHSALVREAGVRAPEVLLRREISDDAVGVVQRFLPGTPLQDLIPQLPVEETQRLVREAGEILARIHSVDAPQQAISFAVATVAEMEAVLDRVGGALAAFGVPPEQVADLVRAHRDALDGWRGCLTHGDFGIDHLIIVDDHVSGVIDLDLASDGIQVVDISWWDTYFDREPHPSAVLVEGYERAAPLREGHERARLVYSVASGVDKFRYYVEVAHNDGDVFMARRLAAWVDQLATL